MPHSVSSYGKQTVQQEGSFPAYLTTSGEAAHEFNDMSAVEGPWSDEVGQGETIKHYRAQLMVCNPSEHHDTHEH